MNKNFRGLAALLVLAGLSTALTACGSMVEGASAGEAAQSLSVHAHDIGFDTQSLQASAGQPVALSYVNDGLLEHAFTVNGLAQEQRVRPGQTHVFTFTPSKPGEYRFYCALPGHEAAGMSGTLTVK